MERIKQEPHSRLTGDGDRRYRYSEIKTTKRDGGIQGKSIMGKHTTGGGRRVVSAKVEVIKRDSDGNLDYHTAPKGSDAQTKDAFKLGKSVMFNSDVTSARSWDDAISRARIIAGRIGMSRIRNKPEVVRIKQLDRDGNVVERMYSGLRVDVNDIPDLVRALKREKVNYHKANNSYFTGVLVS